MTAKNTATRWGGVSQTLHWLIALLILALGIVGLTMGEFPKTPKYFWIYTMHKSIGITVLALVVARLGWRLYAGAPEPVPGTPTWQERIASATHTLLYVLMFAIPLSGWLYDSASGLRPFRWFGLVEVPKLSGPDERVTQVSHTIPVRASAKLFGGMMHSSPTMSTKLPGSKCLGSTIVELMLVNTLNSREQRTS